MGKYLAICLGLGVTCFLSQECPVVVSQVYGGHGEVHMLTPCSLCSSPYTSLYALLILCFPPKPSSKAVSSVLALVAEPGYVTSTAL